MNIRCSFCQTPYAMGRTETLAALQHMEAEKLSHYDAHCPRCRRATPVQRQKLELTFPNWRDALKEMEAASGAASLAAPDPIDQTQGKPAPAPTAESKPESAPAKEPAAKKEHERKRASKAKPAAKPAAKAGASAKTKTK